MDYTGMKLDGNRFQRWLAHRISCSGGYRQLKNRTSQDRRVIRNLQFALAQLEGEKQTGWREAYNTYEQQLRKLGQDHKYLTEKHARLEEKRGLLEQQVNALIQALEISSKAREGLLEDLIKSQKTLREMFILYSKTLGKLNQHPKRHAYVLTDLEGLIYFQSSEANKVLGSQKIEGRKASEVFGLSEEDFALGKRKKMKVGDVSVSVEPVPIYLSGKTPYILFLEKRWWF